MTKIRRYDRLPYPVLALLSGAVCVACLAGIKLEGRNLVLAVILVAALMLFGHSTGSMLKALALKKAVEEKKRLEIEEKDERNRLITDKAGARANALMLGLTPPVLAVLVFMKADLLMTGLLAALILVQVAITVAARIHYSKKY